MLVLGIHMGHDASVCVVDDGRIVSLIERERHTRIKHAAITHADDIDRALKDAGADLKDVDFVSVTATQNWPLVFYDKKEFRFEIDLGMSDAARCDPAYARQFESAARRLTGHHVQYKDWAVKGFNNDRANYRMLSGSPVDFDAPETDFLVNFEFPLYPGYWDTNHSFDALRGLDRDTSQKYVAGALGLRVFHMPLKVTVRGREIPGALIPHHLAHAANAYFQSDKESAMIATYDGGVRKEVFGHAGGLFCVAAGNTVGPMLPNYLTSSNMYSRVGMHLCLDTGPGAPGKLMGLAPYGRPRFFPPEMVGNLYDNPEVMSVEEHFQTKHAWHLIDYATRSAHALGYKDFKPTTETKLSKFSTDLAATTQKLFEEQILASALVLQRFAIASGHPAETLCLSGGGALNCPTNSRLWREGPFENVFVPPTCDDSGLSIGSALYATHTLFDRPRQPQGATTSTSAYLGMRHSQESIEAALEAWRNTLRITRLDDGAPADAAKALAGDEVVAWFEGRSEIGPRALGHRSILADPRVGANWKRVNEIKTREEWRPFAPAVLHEKAADWFNHAPLPSPFMLFTAQVLSKRLPAITHVDGSARIQTVAKDCGGFREVLEEFDKETGVPVVMNTSFNGPGEPIVESADDALRFFETSDLDRLYIGGYRVEHPGPDATEKT